MEECNMKKHIWMALIMAVCMMSCTLPEGHKQTISAGVLEYDSLSIPIDYPYLGFYYRISCYEEGGNLYCAGYNHLMHSIEVFDLTNRCTVQSYELEPEGPNAVLKNQISDFLVNDSLFVFRGFRNDVKVLSRKDGALRKTIMTLSPEDNYQLNFRGTRDGTYGGFEMQWEEQKIVMPLFTKQKQTMEDRLALSVDLYTEEAEILPLSYPEEMKEDLGCYGSLTFPDFTTSEDRWVYNFAYSSRVYIYRKETGEVQVLDMKSNTTPNQASFNDSNLKERNLRKNAEYESTTLRFGSVYYDKTADVYVRMHHAGKEKIMDKRKSYLMVHRCKTGETLEYELPEDLSPQYFVADGCLYIELKNSDDVCLRFAVVDLNLE